MTNMRTMPPLTPPGGVKVVVMNNNNASTDSFSSTSSLLDDMKKQRFPQNAPKSCWNGESLIEKEGRASGTTTTEEESIDKDTTDEQMQVSKKDSSEEEEPVLKVKRMSRKGRAKSFSGSPSYSYATPPYNPFSQHSYSPHRTPGKTISNVSIWMETRRQTPIRIRNQEGSSQSSVESIDSDEELERKSLKIRSEIRQMEMMELALEAERAAEAGEEFFVGVPSTFGDGAASELSTFLLNPPTLKMNRNRTEPILRRPSLLARTRSLQPVTKLKVLALRDVSEVIPRLGELHTHLQSHLAKRGVDQQTLVLHQPADSPKSNDSDTPSAAGSVGQSITFLRKLKLWGSHQPPQSDSTRQNSFGNSMNLWGSPASSRGVSSPKKSFLTPRRRIHHGEEDEFSPNSLIDEGETSHHEAAESGMWPSSRGNAQDISRMSSFDSGAVGKVLAQHIAATPPRTHKPIRVPSGLALPDIGTLSEKDEIDEDIKTNFHNAAQTPSGFREAAETGTISTAFSTSLSFEAGADRNQTPPVSLLDATEEESNTGAVDPSPALDDEVDNSSQMNVDHSDIFITPTRLRDIRDGHRRTRSDGQMLGMHFDQFEVNAIGFVKGDALRTPFSIEELAYSGSAPVLVQSSAVPDLASAGFTLQMRPLNDGLAEFGALDFDGTADTSRPKQNAPSEAVNRSLKVSIDTSHAESVNNSLHGEDFGDPDSMATWDAGAGQPESADELVAPSKTGLDSVSHDASTDGIIAELQEDMTGIYQEQDTSQNGSACPLVPDLGLGLGNDMDKGVDSSAESSLSDSVEDDRSLKSSKMTIIEGTERDSMTHAESMDEPARTLHEENAVLQKSQDVAEPNATNISANIEKTQGIDRRKGSHEESQDFSLGCITSPHQQTAFELQPRAGDEDETHRDEQTLTKLDAEVSAITQNKHFNEVIEDQKEHNRFRDEKSLHLLRKGSGTGNNNRVRSSQGECKNELPAITATESFNEVVEDQKGPSQIRNHASFELLQKDDEKDSLSVELIAGKRNAELPRGTEIDPFNNVVEDQKEVRQGPYQKSLEGEGDDSVAIEGTPNEYSAITRNEHFNENVIDQNELNQSRDDSSLEIHLEVAETRSIFTERMAAELNGEYCAISQDGVLSEVVEDHKNDLSQPSGIPSSEDVSPRGQHESAASINEQPSEKITSSGKAETSDCLLTPTYHTCECLISPVSTTESMSSNLIEEADQSMVANSPSLTESKGSMRRVMSLPSLADAVKPSGEKITPINCVHPRRRFAARKSEPGASSFSSRFDVSALKQRLASGQSEPGASTFASRFDTAAKNMLKRLSSHSECDGRFKSPKERGLFVPVKDNDAFLYNYLYCSKPPEAKAEAPSKPPSAALCETSSVPCADMVGCGGFMGAVDAAMEILPSRTTEKEIFSLNNGSTHSVEETDRWFDAAVERFDGAFERLVGGVHEHGSRWNMNDFRAPSLMVKKTAKSSKTNTMPSESQPSSGEQIQLMYGMSREQFVSLPRSERIKLKEERSLLMSNGNYPNTRIDGHARDDKELSASGVLGMTLLANSYSG